MVLREPFFMSERNYFRGRMLQAHWPLQLENAQAKHTYHCEGRQQHRVRLGDEEEDWGGARGWCKSCFALKGEFHVPGCDVERCPFCGDQVVSCGCVELQELRGDRTEEISAERDIASGRAALEARAPKLCPLGHDALVRATGFRKRCATCSFSFDLKREEWSNGGESPEALQIGSDVMTFLTALERVGAVRERRFELVLKHDGTRQEFCSGVIPMTPELGPEEIVREACAHLPGPIECKERTFRHPVSGETQLLHTNFQGEGFSGVVRRLEEEEAAMSFSFVRTFPGPTSSDDELEGC